MRIFNKNSLLVQALFKLFLCIREPRTFKKSVIIITLFFLLWRALRISWKNVYRRHLLQDSSYVAYYPINYIVWNKMHVSCMPVDIVLLLMTYVSGYSISSALDIVQYAFQFLDILSFVLLWFLVFQEYEQSFGQDKIPHAYYACALHWMCPRFTQKCKEEMISF